MSNFVAVQFDEYTTKKHKELQDAFSGLAVAIDGDLFNGRSKSLALTKLEESFMWVGKAFAEQQLAAKD